MHFSDQLKTKRSYQAATDVEIAKATDAEKKSIHDYTHCQGCA